jgi:hypothetical protein
MTPRRFFIGVYKYVVIPAMTVFVALTSLCLSIYSFKLTLFTLTGRFTFNPTVTELLPSLIIWWPEALIGPGLLMLSCFIHYVYQRWTGQWLTKTQEGTAESFEEL